MLTHLSVIYIAVYICGEGGVDLDWHVPNPGFPAMDIESNARAILMSRVMRIHHESRNSNDVTILSGVVGPRAYCSSAHAV